MDLNGDNDFVDGGGELDDARVHNVANELSTRDTDSNASVNYTLTHDAVGNMTDDGMSYKLVYDVWGRLRQIKDQSNNLVRLIPRRGRGTAPWASCRIPGTWPPDATARRRRSRRSCH
jgi:hypothetical protein